MGRGGGGGRGVRGGEEGEKNVGSGSCVEMACALHDDESLFLSRLIR